MPKAFKATYFVNDGGDLADERGQVFDFFAFLKSYLLRYKGGEVQFAISRPKRSNTANAYMWAVPYKMIAAAIRESGQMITDNDVHKHFKKNLLHPSTIEVEGISITKEPSTANLNSTEFYEYVEGIRFSELALRLGLHIPEPDKNYRSHNITEPS